jgi:uncharacterized protein
MTLVAGIQHIRDGVENQTVLGADMSIVAIVGTADDADATAFPLNAEVYLNTADTTLRAKLGTAGTIPQAIDLMTAQFEGTGAAKVVVVRVAHDDDAFTVIQSIVGNEASRTGMWALLDAPSTLGLTPRLIMVPGYTSQSQNGLGTVTIADGGSSGTDGTFALAFTGGTGSGAAGTFTVTDGAVTAVTITDPGIYTVVPTLDFSASTDLTGTDITVALEQLANPVCAAIPTVLDSLKAVFVPEGPTATRQAWLDWRETLPQSARILHPLRQDAKVSVSGSAVTRPLSPAVIGVYISRDAQNGGVPGKSAANQSLYGLVGVTPVIPFSIIDGNSEGQLDLEQNAGIVVKGDIGVDGALSDSGFVFWGTDTLSADSAYLFAHVVRLRDYMELMQVKAERYYLGRFNITVQTVEAILNTLKSQLAVLKADGFVLDYRVKFEPDRNLPAELRLGNIDVTFYAEEPPVLRKIIIRSRRYEEALSLLVQQVSTALDAQIQ